jgi:hypothetical protein
MPGAFHCLGLISVGTPGTCFSGRRLSEDDGKRIWSKDIFQWPLSQGGNAS